MVALKPLVLSGVLLLCCGARAGAYPLLQFDIKNGVYSNNLQETVATSKVFTLYAYLANPTTEDLNNVYYISAALTPRVFPPGGNFGSFSVANATTSFGYVDKNGLNQVSNSSTFLATQDMVYGNPPLERFQGNTAGLDPGDLDAHGIYNTYFKEFKFKFTLAQRAVPYDVVTDPDNGPTPAISPNKGYMFYQAFTIDTSQLSSAYQLHFDMFSESFKNGDLDVNKFAPFSHTARSMDFGNHGSGTVPEPGSMILLGTGLAALAARYRRRRRGSKSSD